MQKEPLDVNNINYEVLISKINTLRKNYEYEVGLADYISDIYIEYKLQNNFLSKIDKIIEIITKIDNELNNYNIYHNRLISDYASTYFI